jgi:hypothetical protein
MSDLRPWTLKNIPEESRSAAIRAAQRAGVTIGEWVARKLLEAAQADATAGRELAVLPPSPEPARSPSGLDIGHIEKVVSIAHVLSEIPAGQDKGTDAFRRNAMRYLTKSLSTPKPTPPDDLDARWLEYRRQNPV